MCLHLLLDPRYDTLASVWISNFVQPIQQHETPPFRQQSLKPTPWWGWSMGGGEAVSNYLNEGEILVPRYGIRYGLRMVA
jgi:hypothetical protein